MKSVPVAPIGRPANDGYSFVATAASLKKISTLPLVTDPYTNGASLGEGVMAAVYKARQPSVDRFVALKILPREFAADPAFLQRFRHEAKIVAQLQHPHIVPVFDFGEYDGYTLLAMPYVSG